MVYTIFSEMVPDSGSFRICFVFPSGITSDVLLIPLALGARSKAIRFALVCSVASIMGGIAGYGIGYFAWWSGEKR